MSAKTAPTATKANNNIISPNMMVPQISWYLRQGNQAFSNFRHMMPKQKAEGTRNVVPSVISKRTSSWFQAFYTDLFNNSMVFLDTLLSVYSFSRAGYLFFDHLRIQSCETQATATGKQKLPVRIHIEKGLRTMVTVVWAISPCICQ